LFDAHIIYIIKLFLLNNQNKTMSNNSKINLLVNVIGPIFIVIIVIIGLIFFFKRKGLKIQCFKQNKNEESNIDISQEVATVTNKTTHEKENMIVPVAIAGIAIGGVIVVVGLTAGVVATIKYIQYNHHYQSDSKLKKFGLSEIQACIDNAIFELTGSISQIKQMLDNYYSNEREIVELKSALDEAIILLNESKNKKEPSSTIKIRMKTAASQERKITDREDIRKNQIKHINKSIKDIEELYNYFLKVKKHYEKFLQPNEKIISTITNYEMVLDNTQKALGAKKNFEDLEISIRNGNTIQMEPCNFITLPQDSISMLSGRLFIDQLALPDDSMELLPLRKKSICSSASQYSNIYNSNTNTYISYNDRF
jgi:hypothetical protein